MGEQCSENEENLRKNISKMAYQLVKDLTTVKQGKATTVQDRSGKCLTEDRQTPNGWTEYCSELYNYKANGAPSVLNCPQTDTEDDHPILRREVEAAVFPAFFVKPVIISSISVCHFYLLFCALTC